MVTNKVAIGSTLVPQTSGGILALSNAIYDPTGVTTVEQSLANLQTDLDKAKELIPKFNIKIVDSLPDTDVEEGSVYLISKTDGDINQYDEYLYVGKHYTFKETAYKGYTFKVVTEFPTAMEAKVLYGVITDIANKYTIRHLVTSSPGYIEETSYVYPKLPETVTNDNPLIIDSNNIITALYLYVPAKWELLGGMQADTKEKLATLWGIHFPTTMTVSDNGSTAELDKMKIVVFNTGDGTYPTTSITGSKVYKPYNGAETTTAIPASDLADGENCKTYQSASASGKSTYKFTDATSGKTGEIAFRQYLPCYLWLSSGNTETDVNATNTAFNSANSVSDISKTFSENQVESKYIYVAVPIGWGVTYVIAKSNLGSTEFAMKLAAITATHNIYVSESTILNTNGNTINAVGTGSIA